MRRFVPLALGVVILAIPLFPAFITLTGVRVPGVSLVPAPLTLALLGVAVLIAGYGAVLLVATPGEPVPTALAFGALPAAALLSAALGFDPRAGAIFIAIAICGVVLHATIVRFFGDPHVETTIYAAYLASGALAALVAILMVVAKVPADLYTVGHGRATGTFILPGELAGYLVMYVPFAYAIARAGRRDLRPVAYAGALLGAIAFVLTFSRAGWIGMAAAIAFFAYTQRRRARVRVAVAIVGLAVVALGLVFNAHHDPSENFTRISIWQAAADTIARFPLSGVGPFDFATIYPWVRLPNGEPTAFHAHSFLLSVAAELGLIGVIAVGWGWWRFIVALRERLREGSGPSRTIALAIAAGLVGTWVQSLIDTVSIVVFAIWPLFTALALATASAASTTPATVRSSPVPVRRIPRAAIGIACAALLICAFVQLASDAVFARAAAPISLPGRLDPALGTQLYRTIARAVPLPFVEATLAGAALHDGDLDAASSHAERLPAGSVRSETLARIAEARGKNAQAMGFFLDAGDDQALQRHVDRLTAIGRYREAYAFEARVRDRLAAAPTRPNAAADSWWRLGRLAVRLHHPGEARRDFARADAVAPLNTKYLIDAGTLALEQRDWPTAATLFTEARQIDPGSAAAAAGLGLASLRSGDVAQARHLFDAASTIDPRAPLEQRLKHELATSFQ